MPPRAAVVVACATALLAADAHALEPRRKGFQIDVAAGLSACVPDGNAPCRTVHGRTAPLAGGGLTLGYRPLPWLFVGGAYAVAGLRPTYHDILGSNGRPLYEGIRQHALLGVVRTSVDIGRVDLGLEAGIGWSRQVAPYALAERSGERLLSQGLAVRATPLLAVYLTRHVYLGARVDLTFNFHGKVCDGGPCKDPGRYRPAFGHHALFGLALGFTI